MTGGEKDVCLVLAKDNLAAKIKEQLNTHFLVKNITSIQKAVNIIRQQNVLCLIAHADDKNDYSPLELSLITQQFPAIPVIAIADSNNFDLIFSCGKIQMAEIVLDTELDKLQEKVFLVLNRRQLRGGGAIFGF